MTIEEQETVEEVVEAPEAEEPEPAGEPTAEATEPDEDAVEDEVIVSVGDAPPPQPVEEEKDPRLVNKLRKLLREQERKVREYESKLKATAPVEPSPPTLGPKPKLEDLDYDAEKYETAIAAWFVGEGCPGATRRTTTPPQVPITAPMAPSRRMGRQSKAPPLSVRISSATPTTAPNPPQRTSTLPIVASRSFLATRQNDPRNELGHAAAA